MPTPLLKEDMGNINLLMLCKSNPQFLTNFAIWPRELRTCNKFNNSWWRPSWSGRETSGSLHLIIALRSSLHLWRSPPLQLEPQLRLPLQFRPMLKFGLVEVPLGFVWGNFYETKTIWSQFTIDAQIKPMCISPNWFGLSQSGELILSKATKPPKLATNQFFFLDKWP